MLRDLVPPVVPIERMAHQALSLRDYFSGDGIGTWTLEGKRVIALSGLGNPFSFEEMLRRLGANVIPARFPDHHFYRESDLVDLPEVDTASAIVTTPKDAVRLPRRLNLGLPLRVLEVKLSRLNFSGAGDMDELLDDTFHWLLSARLEHEASSENPTANGERKS